MKRVRILPFLMILTLLWSAIPGSASANSDAIAHGMTNKSTRVYWGKSTAFPVLKYCFPNEEFDIYEYDANWVMVLVDTWITQGTQGGSHSFYGYMPRADITCDPALPDGSSAAADTGPGKRKGKKPGNKTSAAPTQAASAAPTEPATEPPEPTPTVEDQEEYDWIIRTPGCCTVAVNTAEGVPCSVSFSLMAQKFGGTAPSSDPTYNHGMHTPYAATMYFSMIATMSDAIANWGLSELMQGSGGVQLDVKAPSARFYLDTGSQDFALVNLSIPGTADAVLNPKITTDTVSGGGEFAKINGMSMTLPVQLRRSGSGYQFVLKGMRPGGGDLTFPAVLEKTFADEDRWQKEAKKADEARKRAEAERKRMEEQAKEAARKAAEEAATKKDGEEKRGQEPFGGDDDEIPLAPLVTPDGNGDIPMPSLEPLAPLVTPDGGNISMPPLESLPPLMPTLEPLAPLVPATAPPEDFPLAPLVPQDGETVDHFPGGK